METQKTLKSQNNIDKKNRAGGITFLDFRLHYNTTVIKQYGYLHKADVQISESI